MCVTTGLLVVVVTITVETVAGFSVFVGSVSSNSGRVQAATNITGTKYESCRFIRKFPSDQCRRVCFWNAKWPTKSIRKQWRLQPPSSNVTLVHNHKRPRRPPKQPSLTLPVERTQELHLTPAHYSRPLETFPQLSLSALGLHYLRLPQIRHSRVTPLTKNKSGQRSDARTKSAIESRLLGDSELSGPNEQWQRNLRSTPIALVLHRCPHDKALLNAQGSLGEDLRRGLLTTICYRHRRNI